MFGIDEEEGKILTEIENMNTNSSKIWPLEEQEEEETMDCERIMKSR